MLGKSGIKKVAVSAVITRADGTKEDLGVIAITTKTPMQRFVEKIKGVVK